MRVKRTAHERLVRRAFLDAELLMAAGQPMMAFRRLDALPPPPPPKKAKPVIPLWDDRNILGEDEEDLWANEDY